MSKDTPGQSRVAVDDARDRTAAATFDASDWAWEFLRRNPDYRDDWRCAVPRHLPLLALADGTQLLRLRRRYPRAERWGLYAFADPFKAARSTPVFWLPAAMRRTVRAHGVSPRRPGEGVKVSLADFNVDRSAVIGVDGETTVTLKGNGIQIALVITDVPALAVPSSLVFELDGLDDLTAHTDALKTLQRFMQPDARDAPRSPFANDDRLKHALIALDESAAGKTYRQIAITIFGEQLVAEDWGGGSEFLKDRTRRLVAKGKELMLGGYRDLL